MIYAITAREIGMVKIGYSKNPKSRIYGLRVSMPFHLVIEGVCDGTRVEERELHKRFKEHHVKGEWFRIEPEVEAFLKTLSPPAPKPKTLKKRKREEEIERLYMDGVTLSEIAKIYGVSRQRIDQIARDLELPKRGHKKSDAWLQSEKIKELGEQGLSSDQIAERLFLPKHMVVLIAKRMGIRLVRGGSKGPTEKTMERVRYVAQAYEAGESTFSISKKLGIQQPSIYRLLKMAEIKPNRRTSKGETHDPL